MKKRLLFVYALSLISYCGFAQAVGIGTNSPDVSAVLDITAGSKGLLVPRMKQ